MLGLTHSQYHSFFISDYDINLINQSMHKGIHIGIVHELDKKVKKHKVSNWYLFHAQCLARSDVFLN